ncbi:hypothetical protein CWI36_2307p0010 [Hamiltosporidium magnivora]|uniref:Uncharacterized protein n=1 Tax=Hamiltosporidium magnivora TaxID=148818 RepID=A0A4Q9KUZ4_9MICR|nr:hypothetical protein CWI36_2307p0010 [Hamiltosporidium magnivora]
MKLECLCQIKRDKAYANYEKNCLERMYLRDSNRQYEQYYIEFIERIGLKFIIFEKFNKMNNNIEIYLCHHIKKSDFVIFYELLISYYLPVYKMTIEKFYTILYCLEYFRKCDKNNLVFLVKSNEMINFDIEKVSFHFIKQHYFSHALFQKILQEYLILLNNGKDLKFSFFIKEKESYISKIYNGILTDDRKHIIIEEFMCYENNNYERYTVPEIKKGDLNITEFIIQNLKHKYQQCSIEEFIKENDKVHKENKNFFIS